MSTVNFDHYSSYNFMNSLDNIEIIPNPNIQNVNCDYYHLNGLHITSPVPQYLNRLFKDNPIITQSSNWSYLYISEEGKYLFESFSALPLNDFLINVKIFLTI